MATRRSAPKTKAPRIEKERLQFKELLLGNPNYFGKVSAEAKFPVVKKMEGNTKYESVSCVGYDPDRRLLEATVLVKLPYGYGGNLCSAGSTEFVRFYVDTGGGWMDAGAAAFNAHDIPNDTDCFGGRTKPLSYVLTVPYDPPRKVCKAPNLPNVRAILSWNVLPPPGQPNWNPPWGNVHDCHIQLRPLVKNHFHLAEILKADLLELKPDYELPFEVPVELDPWPFPWPEPDPGPAPGPPDPGPYFAWPALPTGEAAAEALPFSELARLYTKAPKGKSAAAAGSGKVAAERFGLQAIGPLLETSALELTAGKSLAAEWKSAGLDLSKALAALASTEANTAYEEIECVGLDYNLERLVGTFRVKLPYGYGGNLCGPGSTEYVAFWADWDDDCKWTYVGTTAVNVHDLPVPKEGLCYCATLPVDLSKLRRRCQDPKVVRIRAVLSWAVPPSTTDPDELKFYGNRIDTHVQIQPGPPIGTPEALIAIIGGIPTGKIDAGTGLTTPSAFFAVNGLPPDGAGRPCPFAGIVAVQGPTFVGYRYRVSFRKVGAVAWVPAADSFWAVDGSGTVFTLQTADADGFFAYLPYSLNVISMLARWGSFGDDLYEVQLELADAGDNVLDVTTHRVQLDNTGPVVDVQITGIGGNCGKYAPGTPVLGTFVARDLYLGNWSLATSPQPPAPVAASAPTPSSGTVQTPPAPGSPWTLVTTGMTPCGYTITITAVDRAIVNSASVGHYSSFAQGFCVT